MAKLIRQEGHRTAGCWTFYFDTGAVFVATGKGNNWTLRRVGNDECLFRARTMGACRKAAGRIADTEAVQQARQEVEG